MSLLQENGYDPLVYRMFCLQSHYRKPLEFSYEVLDNMSAAYAKLIRRIAELPDEGEMDETAVAAYRARFSDALCSDLNTSMALTVVYDLLKEETNGRTKRALLAEFDQVLSLNLLTAQTAAETAPAVDAELEAYVEEKIKERKAAKKEKDFAKADAIREELAQKGIVIKDTREGTVWEVQG